MKPFLALLAFCMVVMSCKKDTITTSANAKLSTSIDTLYFDTVFTSVGSTTQYFRIFNDNDQKLRLTNVQLGGGVSSAFKINVDGLPGPSVNDIEIEANDSIYVFVSVKIDPTFSNLPFVVQDSVGIAFNGNQQWVQLQAWGQNANFFRGRAITGDETWNNSKPYVILDGLLIAPGASLTINQGTHVFIHADAPIIVDGTLRALGEKYDSTRVEFRGDRRDEPYRNFPAGWPGIYFRTTSVNNELHFTNILNAYQGVVVSDPSTNANPKLVVNETVIDNCYDAGLLAINSDVRARNCLISNSGKNILLAGGGRYDFVHCTAVSISNNLITHKDPVLFISNFVEDGTVTVTKPLAATFRNCIFWGDNGTVDDEVVIKKQATTPFAIEFHNSLWKAKTDPASVQGVKSFNTLANQNPVFESVNTQRNIYNFRLKDGSPAINKGIPTGILYDLDGNLRAVGNPDLGAYERQ